MKWLREVKKVEELNIIYDAFKNCLNEKPEDYPDDYNVLDNEYKLISLKDGRFVRKYNSYDKYKNEFNISTRFFSFMLAFRGFNAFPKFFTDEDYDKLDARTYYHGFKDFEHGASLLSDWNYHYGRGYALGTYFSDAKYEACDYARSESDLLPGDENKILEVKIMSENELGANMDIMALENFIKYGVGDINNFKIPEIAKQRLKNLIDFKNSHKADLEDKDFERFFENFTTPAILAVYLGFDYMFYYSVNETEHIVVLNRSVIIVPEREFLKFTQNSKSYKGDSIDLEKI